MKIQYYLKLLPKAMREPAKVYNSIRQLLINNKADVFFVSYPKAGRTWLRVMMGHALTSIFDLDRSILLDTYEITKRAGIAKTVFTHDGPFNLYNFCRYPELRFNEALYSGKKLIFIVRDIRDTIVSSYFEQSKRMKTFNGSISTFLRDDVFGIKKIISFYNIWFVNKGKCEDFVLLRYEDMHEHPEDSLNKILAFLGVTGYGPEVIAKAISFSSFENMKKMESKGEFKDSMMKPGKSDDEESYKVRKGKVGGFAEYLNAEDLSYIDEAVAELKIDGCEWYFSSVR